MKKFSGVVIFKIFSRLAACFMLSALAIFPINTVYAQQTEILTDTATGIRLALSEKLPDGAYLACLQISGGELYDAASSYADGRNFVLYDIYVMTAGGTPFEMSENTSAQLFLPLAEGFSEENSEAGVLNESSETVEIINAEFSDGYAVLGNSSAGLFILTGGKAEKKDEINGGLGDIDLDGKIGASDARLALRLAVGFDDGLSETSKKNADVDEDAAVTAADARFILRYSVGLM